MAKKTKTPKPASSEVVKRLFHETLVLSSIRMVESHCKLSIAGIQPPSELLTNAHVKFGNATDTVLLGNLVVELKPKDGDPSFVDILVDVQCVFDAESIPKPETLTDEEKAGLHSLVMVLAWPYVRLFVQTATSAMGIPPFTLPLFRPQFKLPPVVMAME